MKLNLPGLYPLALASGVSANNSLIGVKTPTYVAGFERGVLPIGVWSILMILSMFSTPSIESCFPGCIYFLLMIVDNPLYNTWLIRLLLPEPLTPVTQVNNPSGMSISTFFRLFSLAPLIVRNFPFPGRLFSLIGITSFLDKYLPVMDSSDSIISSGVPSAMILPPCSPAPGPMSIT